jgi:hypothetical protein
MVAMPACAFSATRLATRPRPLAAIAALALLPALPAASSAQNGAAAAGLVGPPVSLISPAAAPSVERLAWLAGCWRSEGGEAGSGEQWLPLAGQTLLGAGRTVRAGATVGYEFMQIRQQADGSVVFAALPNGRNETLFTLLPGAPLEAVFENAGNDFPQRVIYRLEDGGRLRARIEGRRGGAPAGIDFPMQRTPCDALPPRPGAFQGLAWGASELQMAQRFGAALRLAECPPFPKGTPPAVGPAREACDHPTLAPYDVAGVPFRLHLHVDAAQRQLVRVALAWAGEAAQATASDTGWSDKHRRLRQLLVQRYGNPETTHVDTDGGLHSAVARWRVGETLIELKSSYQAHSGNSPAREQVGIVYQPVHAGEAGRL